MKSRSRAGTTQHHNSQHHLTHKSSRTQMKCAWLVAWCHWAIQLSICPLLDDVAPRWLAASWENEIIFLFDIISGGSGWNLYSWKCGFIFCVNLTERNVLLQWWYRKDFDKTVGNAKHDITRPLLYILHQHLCHLHEYHVPLAITPVMAGILFWILDCLVHFVVSPEWPGPLKSCWDHRGPHGTFAASCEKQDRKLPDVSRMQDMFIFLQMHIWWSCLPGWQVSCHLGCCDDYGLLREK